jgi:hypothetical protein
MSKKQARKAEQEAADQAAKRAMETLGKLREIVQKEDEDNPENVE